MAAETQTQEQARTANEHVEDRGPVMWGDRYGDRVSFTVKHGMLWLHVYTMGRKDGKPKSVKLCSMPVRPDQGDVGGAHMREGARRAQIQDEEYREARRNAQYSVNWGA